MSTETEGRPGEAHDRSLLERDPQLAALAARLDAARSGSGATVLIESPAGAGRSRLLARTAELALEADMEVLSARANPLESEFPFGVAIQLFEPHWLAFDPDHRARLLAGPARLAGELLVGAPEPLEGVHRYSVIHGLFRLCSKLASPPADDLPGGPTVLLVDDAHLADAPSLRFLAYLAERIADLPAVLVLAARAGASSADMGALQAVRELAAASGGVLTCPELTPDGVDGVVRSVLPDADSGFCSACARLTSGNPLLLAELLDHVREDGSPPDASTLSEIAEMPPESVLRAVQARLAELDADARRVASAVAVLGDGASLRRVAELAKLDMESASAGADGLAAAHLLGPGEPLSFLQPLVRAAVGALIPPLERGQAHRRAARLLIEDGAGERQTAEHLLAAPPERDPQAINVLRGAARRALDHGAADRAVRMLERALAEKPSPEVYADVVGELAEAESSAGLPQAVDRLEHAISVTDDLPRIAELALTQARALADQRDHRRAAGVLAVALDQVDDRDLALADDLEAAYISAALHVPELAPAAAARGRDTLSGRIADSPSGAQRVALAGLAAYGSLHGEDRASISWLADRAWGNGALLEASDGYASSWPFVAGALFFIDELERDLDVCEAVLSRSRVVQSVQERASAESCRSWPLYEQGAVREAAQAARAALAALPAGQSLRGAAQGALACCLIEAGELEQAESTLPPLERDHPDEGVQAALLLNIRAQLRFAQLRPRDALDDATEAGRRLQSAGAGPNPGAIAWRSTAALAHLALGEPDRARELASEELEQARWLGIRRVMIRNLRVLGLAARGREGIEILTEAVAAGEDQPPRLETIHALIDLGAALRRGNQRARAREPLRRGLELAHRGGANALAQRAQKELFAAGARPRRAMLSGPESLTPSERGVAEMAAKGLTTKQVAEALFVSPKTVEFHLRHIYRKLDVRSRAELARAMRESE